MTADKRNAVILTPPMIKAGMHLNAVGGDCPGKTELHADILRMPNVRVVVEYEPQSRIEGEVQQMAPRLSRWWSSPTSRAAPRRVARRRTTSRVFDSVGFALEDYSALRFLHSLLREQRGAAS